MSAEFPLSWEIRLGDFCSVVELNKHGSGSKHQTGSLEHRLVNFRCGTHCRPMSVRAVSPKSATTGLMHAANRDIFDRCVGADEQRRWHREAEWTAFIWERTDWRL